MIKRFFLKSNDKKKFKKKSTMIMYSITNIYMSEILQIILLEISDIFLSKNILMVNDFVTCCQ